MPNEVKDTDLSTDYGNHNLYAKRVMAPLLD